MTLGAGVIVVGLAGAAFACTQTQGKITITGVGGTTGSATYTHGSGAFGDPEPSNQGYCGGKPSSRVALTTAALSPIMSFRLDVEPGTCTTPSTTDTVNPGLWQVRWVKTVEAIDTVFPYPDCHKHASASTEWKPIGTMTVLPGGTGTGVYALAGSDMQGPGNICLSTNVQPTVDAFSGASDDWGPPVIPMKWLLV